MSDMWSFRKIAAIEEPVFNNTLERFYNLGIDGLVRENIQNSLDGKLQESDEPVKVIIKTGSLTPEQIPGIDEVYEHIRSLKGGNSYTKETIDHMCSHLDDQEIPYISFEDCNTKGLSGAEHGEKYQDGDTWGVYAYKKGVHYIEDDTEFENLRGGSHGVGKIACNAASDLYMMFFANCDGFNKQHLGGTVQLIEHCLNRTNYRATGYFTKVKGDVYYPFENTFDPVFSKTTRGLKIIIPFLRQQFQGKEAIVRAVCDNFFVAILENKLIATVDDIAITKNSIQRIVSDKAIYPIQDYSEIKDNFTPLYIKTYTSKKPSGIEIKDRQQKRYQFNLYIMYDEQIKKGRTAVIRGIGMKIEDRKITSYVNSSYNAVLIPSESNGDFFLKTLENESHTMLSYDHIKNPVLQKNAKYFINDITRMLQKVIAEIIKAAHPTDGAIDTSEQFYSLELNFKHNLAKNVSSVEVSTGRTGGIKEIMKVKSGKAVGGGRGGKGKGKGSGRGEGKGGGKTSGGFLEVIKNVFDRKGQETGEQKTHFELKPEAVKRIVLRGTERISIDFNQSEQYGNQDICDVYMYVIDGTGRNYPHEFSVTDSYSSIKDKTTGIVYKVENNSIKDVSIKDGIINLEMSTTSKFNENLKFLYYVEM